MVAVMQRPLDMLMQGLGAPLRLVYASNRIDLPGVYTKPRSWSSVVSPVYAKQPSWCGRLIGYSRYPV